MVGREFPDFQNLAEWASWTKRVLEEHPERRQVVLTVAKIVVETFGCDRAAKALSQEGVSVEEAVALLVSQK